MEKEVKILFYKDTNSDKLKVFMDKKDSSGKKFHLIKIQENIIDSSQYSPEEKKIMKENLMINHYISLLQNGYQYMQILNEINNFIELTNLKTNVSDSVTQLDIMDIISQLEVEKQYLEKANILFSQVEQVEDFPFVKLSNGAISELNSTDGIELKDSKLNKITKR